MQLHRYAAYRCHISCFNATQGNSRKLCRKRTNAMIIIWHHQGLLDTIVTPKQLSLWNTSTAKDATQNFLRRLDKLKSHDDMIIYDNKMIICVNKMICMSKNDRLQFHIWNAWIPRCSEKFSGLGQSIRMTWRWERNKVASLFFPHTAARLFLICSGSSVHQGLPK